MSCLDARAARIACLSLALVLSACGGVRMVPFEPTQTVLLSQAAAPQDLRAAIVSALERRRLHAISETPGMMTVEYAHRTYRVQLQISYRDTGYEISHVSSQGYLQDIDPETGVARIDRRYLGLRRGLRRSIDRELDRIYEQRQEAIDQQRDHQLRLAAEHRRRAEMDREAERLRRMPPAAVAPPPRAAPPRQGPVAIPVPLPNLPTPSVPPIQGGTSHQSFTCCINGRYHECPSRAAFQQCSTSGGGSCERMPQHDNRC